jgi:ATP-dependent helicase/nuclease subunit A
VSATAPVPGVPSPVAAAAPAPGGGGVGEASAGESATAAPAPPGIAWSDAALALFDLEGDTAVSAGAGAGKTTALVELMLRLLAGDTPLGACAPHEVVAITFTERAGAELQDRLAAELLRAGRAAAARGDAGRAERLEGSGRDLPSMAVGTIHGFASRLLREHAADAGVDPDFAVLEEDAAAEVLAEASRAAALRALDGGDPPVRALAAGHGGAEGLAALAASLVRERATRGATGPPGVAEEGPVAVERARAEVEAAARELVALAGRATTASGGKALAALEATLAELEATPAVLEATPAALQAEPAAVALRWARLGEAVKGWRGGKGDPPELAAARERLKRAAGELPGVAAEWLAAPQARALAALVADVEERYAEVKGGAGALDFDDLLVRARDLLRGAPAVLADLRGRTRALLVDEYQDVNGLQAEIFALLAGPGGGARPVLVAVGDAKQSIYRFRGADVGVFAGLLERLGAGGGGRVHHLRENHRSAPAVIDVVNDVLDRSAADLGVPFGPEDRLRATRSSPARPAAELLLDGGGGNAEARRAREAKVLAARIRDVLRGRAGVEVRERGPDGAEGARPARAGDIAILFRRLTQVAVYERALRDAGVPFRLARGGGFYRAPEVRDLAELCASLAEPADEIAWAALLRSPLCAVSDGSLLLLGPGRLARLARTPPAAVAAGLEEAWGGSAPAGEGERLRRFLEAWQRLHALRDRLDVGELLACAAEAVDLEAALLAAPDGERRARNLRKALALARRAAGQGLTAGAFAARLRRLAARPPREPEADLGAEDAVSLLSVHQAKGLEWPIVAVPDLAGRAPTGRARALLDEAGRVCVTWFDLAAEAHVPTASLVRLRERRDRAESAESRRLLYVALTRARDHLVLSGTGEDGAAGGWARLVLDVPSALLRRVPAATGATGGVTDQPAGRTTDGVTEGTGEAAATEACGALGAGAAGGAGRTGGSPQPAALLRPPLPPADLRVAVTAVVEYARCPRRDWYGRHLRLPEPRGIRGEDDAERATERGSLVHALLSEVDLLAPPLERRVLLAASAARRGRDPSSPATARMLRDVERFLSGDAGRRLAAWARAGTLSREVPFLLRLGDPGGPACYLDGAIDALAEEREGIRVVDFKYAALRPGAADVYRLQLAVYALAAGRAHPGRPVRAELWFLRGQEAVVDVTPSPGDLARLAAGAPGWARGALAAAGRDATPEGIGRGEARCRAEGCGWVERCFRPGEPSRAEPSAAPGVAGPPIPGPA